MCKQNLKIGDNICKNIDFLKRISRSKSERRQKRILKHATSGELLAIVESALNIVKSRFNLTNRQKNKIVPHTEFIRRLTRVRSEKSARQLVQKGRGVVLPAILTPIIISALKQILL